MKLFGNMQFGIFNPLYIPSKPSVTSVGIGIILVNKYANLELNNIDTT